MIWLFLTMAAILAIACAVVLYVVYPHRGEEMPHTPWVGRAMRKGVRRLPTLQNQREW